MLVSTLKYLKLKLLGRLWKTMFAHQFIIKARPNKSINDNFERKKQNRKIGILIINLCYTSPMAYSERLIEICKSWSKDGYSISVLIPKITYDATKSIFNNKRVGISLYALPFSSLKRSTYEGVILEYIRRCLTIFIFRIPISIDVVYSLTGLIIDVFAAWWFKVRRPNLKWVALIDNIVPPPSQRPGNWIYKSIAYLAFHVSIKLMKKADLIIYSAPPLKEKLIMLGIPAEKLRESGNGIAFEELDLAEEPKNKIYDACFLGRIHTAKGVFDLIKIWKIVSEEYKDAKLVLMGTGDKNTVIRLKNKIESNGLSQNIILLGYVSSIKKFETLKSSKLFIFPSYDESYPISVMEALACGLPVIAYDLPVYKKVFPGLLKTVQIYNVQKFANAVLMLLKDKNLYEQLSFKGKQKMKNFTWDVFAKREIDYIDQLFYEK